MCGITFILSKKEENVIDYALNSLERIQNRGYDSIGICYSKSDSKYDIIKKASGEIDCFDCFDLLKNHLNESHINSHVVLGYTRWATHGSKTESNAHPHISQQKNIILAHNGIINNFYELKIELTQRGYTFYSETDTEIIANLIEYYLIKFNYNIENAIEIALNRLEGTWALVIIYTKDPNTYYITRKGSPMLLGSSDKYIMCCSEADGFIGLIYNYIIIDNNDIIKITDNKYSSIINKSNSYTVKEISNDLNVLTRGNYSHWMLKEIMEQPDTLQKAFNYGGRIINNTVKLGGLDTYKMNIINNHIEYILIIGCGTSYNAGLIAQFYFNSDNTFITTLCVNACEFTDKNIPNIENKSKIACIFLSQSGETIDAYNCLKICKDKGCLTIGVINKVDSLIARNVDCGVYLNCGSEISVASTKSFTSMLLCLSLIQLWFKINVPINDNIYIGNTTNNRHKLNNSNNTNNTNNTNNYKIQNILNSMRILPNMVTGTLNSIKLLKYIDNIKNKITGNNSTNTLGNINANINNIFILGKGKMYPIACEGSLKIKEICYIHSEPFSAGALKHGPFALLDETNMSILLIDHNDSSNYHSLKSTYYEIASRKTNLVVITNNISVLEELDILNSDNYILLDSLEYYNEILFVIILQYLAYVISIEKNINPDKPRNLAKVVTVE